jgi:hypothetical protein
MEPRPALNRAQAKIMTIENVDACLRAFAMAG